MIKILKIGFLAILVNIGPKLLALDLRAELERIELEDRDAWKIVYLTRLLNEYEQIEALEEAIREKMIITRDFSLDSKILHAKNDYRNNSERALLLQGLLSRQEYINALNKKVRSKAQTYAGA